MTIARSIARPIASPIASRTPIIGGGGGGEPTPFTPLSIASCRFLLDASDLSTLFQDSGTTPVTASGQAVGQWNDKTANGFHLRQETPASRPIYTVASGKQYIDFDGSNDSFGTIIPVTYNSNVITVVIGLRKDSDAAVAMVAESSATINSNQATWYVVAPEGASPTYALGHRGSSIVTVSATGYAAPISNVLTCEMRRVTDQWLTSIQVDDNAAVQSTATLLITDNFVAHTLFIGRRNNTSLPFNGQISRMAIFNELLSAENKTAVKVWAGALL